MTVQFLNFKVAYSLKFELLHIVISKIKVTSSREERILVRPLFLLNATDARAFAYNWYNETNKLTNIKIIFCAHNLSELRHVSIYLDHLQGIT